MFDFCGRAKFRDFAASTTGLASRFPASVGIEPDEPSLRDGAMASWVFEFAALILCFLVLAAILMFEPRVVLHVLHCFAFVDFCSGPGFVTKRPKHDGRMAGRAAVLERTGPVFGGVLSPALN